MGAVSSVGTATRIDSQLRQRLSDGVDRLVRQHRADAVLQIGIGLGIVGFGGTAVAEKIDGEHGLAGVGEKVDPAGLAPSMVERRPEAMDEEDRLVAHGMPIRSHD